MNLTVAVATFVEPSFNIPGNALIEIVSLDVINH